MIGKVLLPVAIPILCPSIPEVYSVPLSTASFPESQPFEPEQKRDRDGIWSSKDPNSTPLKNPNLSHLHWPHYDAVSCHSHIPDSPARPVVSDHEPFPQLDGHSIPEETAHREASPQKSQLETPRSLIFPSKKNYYFFFFFLFLFLSNQTRKMRVFGESFLVFFFAPYIYALQFMPGGCGYVKLGFLENEFSDLVDVV